MPAIYKSKKSLSQLAMLLSCLYFGTSQAALAQAVHAVSFERMNELMSQIVVDSRPTTLMACENPEKHTTRSLREKRTCQRFIFNTKTELYEPDGEPFVQASSLEMGGFFSKDNVWIKLGAKLIKDVVDAAGGRNDDAVGPPATAANNESGELVSSTDVVLESSADRVFGSSPSDQTGAHQATTGQLGRCNYNSCRSDPSSATPTINVIADTIRSVGGFFIPKKPDAAVGAVTPSQAWPASTPPKPSATQQPSHSRYCPPGSDAERC